MSVKISQEDELRLRVLAQGMVQNIRDPKDILAELGFTEDDWRELERSRTFKRIMSEAQAEWHAASSTSRRVKLKASNVIEQVLPDFFHAMTDGAQPLVARVRALEIVSKLAGLPEQEAQERAPGAQFKLEIHLGGPENTVISVGIPDSPTLRECQTREQVQELHREAVVKSIVNAHESFKLPDYYIDDSTE